MSHLHRARVSRTATATCDNSGGEPLSTEQIRTRADLHRSEQRRPDGFGPDRQHGMAAKSCRITRDYLNATKCEMISGTTVATAADAQHLSAKEIEL